MVVDFNALFDHFNMVVISELALSIIFYLTSSCRFLWYYCCLSTSGLYFTHFQYCLILDPITIFSNIAHFAFAGRSA